MCVLGVTANQVCHRQAGRQTYMQGRQRGKQDVYFFSSLPVIVEEK